MPDSVYESILALAAERLLELRLIREISIPVQSLGAEFSITVPGGTLWELFSVITTLSTSATVANRTPTLTILDPDGNRVYRFGPAAVVPATTFSQLTFTSGIGNTLNLGPNSSMLPNPPIVIPASFQIVTATGLIDAGDQYLASRLMVRQWNETEIIQETGVIADQIQSLYGREVTGR